MSTERVQDQVEGRLQAASQRFTSGRRRIVAALADHDGPMTINQILEREDSLPQSSVYRNLAVLEEVGVVDRIVTGDDFARYELAEDLTDHHHHHLICAACGDVADFALDDGVEGALDDALGAVAAAAGFEVERHRLDLIGRCHACRDD